MLIQNSSLAELVHVINCMTPFQYTHSHGHLWIKGQNLSSVAESMLDPCPSPENADIKRSVLEALEMFLFQWGFVNVTVTTHISALLSLL